LETGDVADVLLSAAPGQPILVDCLTLWLTRVLDESDAWDGDTSLADKQVERLLDAWRRTEARVVVVSNEVGQGVVPQTASGRLFRDLHGRLNAAVAAASDDVTFMLAGRPVQL
jgi:adenosylcobinamide kinase/adenosylcobinamide-phosphate guanylyltransferase